jgi:hypothetical protein
MLDRVGVGPLVVNRGHPLNRGRISWWLALPGINYGGARWYDLIGSYHGTPTNGPAWRGTTRPGGYGQLRLDGSNDYVNFGDLAAFEFASGQAFTIAFWFQGTASGSQQGLLTKGYDGVFINNDIPWYLFRWNANGASGHLDAFLRSGSGDVVLDVGGLTDNGWHHAALSYGGGPSATLYVDGGRSSATGSSAVAAAYGTNAGPLILGTHAAGYFAGDVDDVAVWKGRALSAAEAWSLYDLSRRGYPGVLVRAGWPAATPAAAGAAFVAPRPLVVGQAVTRAAYY